MTTNVLSRESVNCEVSCECDTDQSFHGIDVSLDFAVFREASANSAAMSYNTRGSSSSPRTSGKSHMNENWITIHRFIDVGKSDSSTSTPSPPSALPAAVKTPSVRQPALRTVSSSPTRGSKKRKNELDDVKPEVTAAYTRALAKGKSDTLDMILQRLCAEAMKGRWEVTLSIPFEEIVEQLRKREYKVTVPDPPTTNDSNDNTVADTSSDNMYCISWK